MAYERVVLYLTDDELVAGVVADVRGWLNDMLEGQVAQDIDEDGELTITLPHIANYRVGVYGDAEERGKQSVHWGTRIELAALLAVQRLYPRRMVNTLSLEKVDPESQEAHTARRSQGDVVYRVEAMLEVFPEAEAIPVAEEGDWDL
jgi:hypothetical protein